MGGFSLAFSYYEELGLPPVHFKPIIAWQRWSLQFDHSTNGKFYYHCVCYKFLVKCLSFEQKKTTKIFIVFSFQSIHASTYLFPKSLLKLWKINFSLQYLPSQRIQFHLPLYILLKSTFFIIFSFFAKSGMCWCLYMYIFLCICFEYFKVNI